MGVTTREHEGGEERQGDSKATYRREEGNLKDGVEEMRETECENNRANQGGLKGKKGTKKGRKYNSVVDFCPFLLHTNLQNSQTGSLAHKVVYTVVFFCVQVIKCCGFSNVSTDCSGNDWKPKPKWIKNHSWHCNMSNNVSHEEFDVEPCFVLQSRLD